MTALLWFVPVFIFVHIDIGTEGYGCIITATYILPEKYETWIFPLADCKGTQCIDGSENKIVLYSAPDFESANIVSLCFYEDREGCTFLTKHALGSHRC